MEAAKSYKPEGFPDVTPYFVVKLGTGAKLIQFLERPSGQGGQSYRSSRRMAA